MILLYIFSYHCLSVNISRVTNSTCFNCWRKVSFHEVKPLLWAYYIFITNQSYDNNHTLLRKLTLPKCFTCTDYRVHKLVTDTCSPWVSDMEVNGHKNHYIANSVIWLNQWSNWSGWIVPQIFKLLPKRHIFFDLVIRFITDRKCAFFCIF